MHKKYENRSLIVLSALLLSLVASAPHAHAEDTETKMKNSASDVNTGVKKDVRKSKKTVRNATGHHNAAKDAEDAAGNAKDDTQNEVQKAKNRANQ